MLMALQGQPKSTLATREAFFSVPSQQTLQTLVSLSKSSLSVQQCSAGSPPLESQVCLGSQMSGSWVPVPGEGQAWISYLFLTTQLKEGMCLLSRTPRRTNRRRKMGREMGRGRKAGGWQRPSEMRPCPSIPDMVLFPSILPSHFLSFFTPPHLSSSNTSPHPVLSLLPKTSHLTHLPPPPPVSPSPHTVFPPPLHTLPSLPTYPLTQHHPKP